MNESEKQREVLGADGQASTFQPQRPTRPALQLERAYVHAHTDAYLRRLSACSCVNPQTLVTYCSSVFAHVQLAAGLLDFASSAMIMAGYANTESWASIY